jgi:hypothetical protein
MPGTVEKEAESVFGHWVVVQTDAGADGDTGGVEPGVQDVIRTGSEGLDPSEVFHALGGILQVVPGVRPSHQDIGVDKLLRDGSLHIVRVKRYGEALEAINVERDRGRIEKFHREGG